jgi:4-amino-4-deoxy-L-arabinose transferase-like glycosyltransferase
MRSVNLLRIAIEAETLRLRHMLRRHGTRAAFGVVATIFALSVLVLCDVAGWQVLRLYVVPLYATLILLGVNLVLAIAFTLLAVRSSPSHAEREALMIRQQALQGAQGSLALAALVPVAGNILRLGRRRESRWWRFGSASDR